MVKLKPALTYEEQILRLKNVHNLTIQDEASAIDILKCVNYYRLSAYGLGLTKGGNSELYSDGITLEHLYRLYQFDCLFRNHCMHIVEQLEIQLRTQISNHLALKYGPEGYVNPSLFSDKKTKDGELIHTTIIDNFKKECERQKNTPFVKHHLDKYEGHFPIWVAVELFTFGNLSSLYSIMLPEDRKAIATLYKTEPCHLGSWILSLVEVRNICAHYGRLYNMPLKQTPFLYPENRRYRSSAQSKIFLVLLSIKRMLNGNSSWVSFYRRIENLIDEYGDVIKLSFMGFPNNWKQVLQP